MIAAQRISGKAVATADARKVASTGPITQISSCAVVSSAKRVRTWSFGTIRGYRARTTGMSGGAEAPTSSPSPISSGAKAPAKTNANVLIALITAAAMSVRATPTRPARRAVIGRATASPTPTHATTVPASPKEWVSSRTCSRIASDRMPSGRRAKSCDAVTFTTPGTRSRSR